MRENRHPRLGLDARDEAFAATRHDYIESATEPREHFTDRRAVPYRYKAYRGHWQSSRAKTRHETFMDALGGKKAFRTGAQDCRIAGLQTKRACVRRHRRAAFVNDADDAERSRDALDQKPVR